MTVIDTPEGIKFYRLVSMRGAIRLEAKGMRMSRGSVTARAKREFGIKGNRTEVLAFLDAEIERMKAER